MTCRKPTISVRTTVLQRLAEAASKRNADGAPDSMEFEEMSWQELERTSLVDGITDLVLEEQARIQEELRNEELRAKENELRRLDQIARAEVWERQVMETKRAEQFAIRMQEEAHQARLAARRTIIPFQQAHERKLEVQRAQQQLERVAVRSAAEQKRNRWQLITSGALAAAAAFTLTLGVTMKEVDRAHESEISRLALTVSEEESAARTRVAELEAELERTEDSFGHNRSALEEQLKTAQLELAEISKQNEELDRRTNRDQAPRKLAEKPVIKQSKPDGTSQGDSGVKVATDVVPEANCSAYDPMCFDL